jgi:transmembrane sensor
MLQESVKNIVFAFFAGNATSLQKKWIEEWLMVGENQVKYYEWLAEWEQAQPQFIASTDKAWDTLLSRIENGKIADNQEYREELMMPFVHKNSNLSNKNFPFRRWLLIAASISSLLICSVLFFRNDIVYVVYKTSYGEIKNFQLPDGSKVTLNANSELKVWRWNFGAAQREVFLKGEAIFFVVHTLDHQRFLVKTSDAIEVEVLGTEFVVYSRDKGSKVALHSGKVKLRSLRNEKTPTLTMKKGDVVMVNLQGQFQLKEKQATEAHLAWKEHRFVFDDTKLREVAEMLKENFGVEVQIKSSKLANRSVSGTFTAQNAHEIMNVLAELLEIKVRHVTHKDKEYFIWSE